VPSLLHNSARRPALDTPKTLSVLFGPLTLAPTLDLWLLSTATAPPPTLAALRDCLPPTELAQRRSPQAQRQFVLSRGCLRLLLSRYTGLPAAAHTFVYGPRGKPTLAPGSGGDRPGLPFNVSHSGQRLLIALGQSPAVTAIGVDLEAQRPVKSLARLCQRCLTAAEAKTMLTLVSPQADDRFLRYWVAKEACLKALGLGIADAMESLEITLPTAAPSLRPVALPVHGPGDRPFPGQLYQWQPAAGYSAAIALQGYPLGADRWWVSQTTPEDLLAGTAAVRDLVLPADRADDTASGIPAAGNP
jgi:4'-phosphopantetheinyl transferase